MSGGGTSTVQNTLPPELVPYYQAALGGGLNLLNQPASNMVAPLNPIQQAGIEGTVGQSLGPSASQGASNWDQYVTSGALLNPQSNPYLSSYYNAAADQVQPRIASEFAGAGSNAVNSTPVQSDELNNLAAQIYEPAYAQGLQATNQAALIAPNIQQGTYMPWQALSGAGGTVQQQQQNILSAPYNALSWYSGLLGSNAAPFGGSRASQNPNQAATNAGYGLMGASILEQVLPYLMSG